ncbi:MAG TPA: hypothetical protein VFI13_12705, partial [Gemmatimonadales bacterium]|nr:hypothetical protein [Gemmatimonadales bacterium]
GLAAVAGLGIFLATATRGASADRAWQLFHVNWLFFTSLSGGSLALTATHKVAKAKWSGAILRFAEAAGAFMPLSLLGLVLIFTVGYDHIYGPMQAQLHTLSAGKALWLSRPWMFTRLFVTLGLLTWLGGRMVWTDMLGDFAHTAPHLSGERKAKFERWGAGFDEAANEVRLSELAPRFAVLYAITFTLVAFDGVMALQPHWYSNLLGGFFFMGAFLAAHALLALTMMYGVRHLDLVDLVSPKQRHDLGKMVFGFTVFWAYLMWAQFLVIWYGNMPEETGFVFARLWGHWMPIGRAVLLGMFVIPFIGLLGVAPKKFPFTLGLFTSVTLVAFWLERYLLVLPSLTTSGGPQFGLVELGPTLAFLGLFLVAYALFARAFPMVSPRLALRTLEQERAHGHGGASAHDEDAKDFTLPNEMERRDRPRA